MLVASLSRAMLSMPERSGPTVNLRPALHGLRPRLRSLRPLPR